MILDLDETLVHSMFQRVEQYDFTVSIMLAGESNTVYVRKRPGAEHFLNYVCEKFETYIFTASLANYADPVIEVLDP